MKKISLEKIHVKSFVTHLNTEKRGMIRGGSGGDGNCSFGGAGVACIPEDHPVPPPPAV